MDFERDKFIEELQRVIEDFKKRLRSFSLKGANPSVIADREINVYGSMLTISKIANILPHGDNALAVVAHSPDNLEKIYHKLQQLNLGHVTITSHSVLVEFPPLTAEIVKDIVAQIKKIYHQHLHTMGETRKRLRNSFEDFKAKHSEEFKKIDKQISLIVKDKEDELKQVYKSYLEKNNVKEC